MALSLSLLTSCLGQSREGSDDRGALRTRSEVSADAEWDFPLPDEISLLEYAPAAESGRHSEAIELHESLVLGGGNDSRRLLAGRPDIAVDERGTLYVVDRDSPGVRVFNSDGIFVRRFGEAGQGPDAINEPVGIALSGENHVVVADDVGGRLSLWSLAGEPVAMLSAGESRLEPRLFGATDGSVFFSGRLTRVQGFTRARYFDVFWGGDAEARQRLFLAELLTTALRIRNSGSTAIMPMRGAHEPDFAVSGDGAAYFTTGRRYQVLAFDASGQPKWALRVPWERVPIPAEDVAKTRSDLQQRYEVGPGEMPEVPVLRPAISHLAVDGQGRLYVYPFADSGLEYRVVDVYSPEGERIYSGTVRNVVWRKSRGEFVYGWYVSRQDHEWRLARWRLVTPF